MNTGMDITAPNIKRFISKRKRPEKDQPVDQTDQISSEYMNGVEKMLGQVQLAQNDHWQKTSRQAALLWNRVIREKILFREAGDGSDT